MKILCVTDYYLPGYKGGGPITTLVNMQRQLAGDVCFWVFTRDRDLGEDSSYPEIEVDGWSDHPGGQRFYATPRSFGPSGMKKALAKGRFDVLYLNSFFSWRSSIWPNLSLRGLPSVPPILLAPRGEFSLGALALKSKKKRLFLTIARALGLYRNVSWHASSESEAEDILRQFPSARGKIFIAPDPVHGEPPRLAQDCTPKRVGQLRLAFISRISPKKNLDGLLEVLAAATSEIALDVFGPIEEPDYWADCEKMIANLPSNVRVTWRGLLKPDEVSKTFAEYDLFAFPTHGENFGHVIFEAIRAGTPVILSEGTPWVADEAGALQAIPLGKVDEWRRAIERAAQRDEQAQSLLRIASLDYAQQYIASDQSRAANLAMFRSFDPASHDESCRGRRVSELGVF